MDSKNNFIQRIQAPEGERMGVLFSFAKGEKRIQLSEKLHFKAGESMARIHQFSENKSLNRITYIPKVLLNDSLESLKGFLSSNTVEMDFMKATQERLLNLFANINEKELRKGIVHLDIWPDNMNVTENGEITIFDFDFCGNGWLCLDLAYYLMQLHFIEKDINERSSKIQSFLNGYESISKIPNEEKQIFQMLGVSLYFFYLGVQCRRFENWSNVFLSKYQFETVLEMGCGTGKNTVWLVSQANQVFSFDFSAGMLVIAKDKVQSENVQCQKADLTKEWDVQNEFADLVTFNLVLEHVEDLGFVFSQAFQKLRKGGILFICELDISLHPFKQYQGSYKLWMFCTSYFRIRKRGNGKWLSFNRAKRMV